MSQIALLTHQLPIIEQLAIDREKGKSLVVIPSGAGKTHIAAFDSLAANAQSILYIAHRKEILRQAKEIFKIVHDVGDADIGFIDKDRKDFDKRIIFATNNSLANSKNLDIISTKKIDYVIIDEYHHVAAKTYQKILSQINSGFLLGLTATPFRADNRNIMRYVNNNVSGQMTLEEGIKKGILVPFRYNGLHDNIDYSDIEWNGRKYKESDLDRKLVIDNRDSQIVREYLRLIGRGHPSIGFCVSVRHCERISNKFNMMGISARYITHDTPDFQRQQNVEDFSKKKYDVLFVRDIFNEGIDFPFVEGILFLRPTWSRNVFFQQLGRGLRKADNKTHVTILDFIGNYHHAFRLQKWLGFAIDSKGDLYHEPDKQTLSYEVPYVHFDRKVIDIFKHQSSQRLPYPPTKEMLIEQYHRYKQLLGQSGLACEEFTSKRRSPDEVYYHAIWYQRLWGGWFQFLNDIGDWKSRKGRNSYPGSTALPTKQQLIDEYRKLKVKLNISRTLPQSLLVYPNTKWGAFIYWRVWGSYSTFLREIGEIPIKGNTRETLIQNYQEVKRKLGRVPTQTEMVNKSISRVTAQCYRNSKYWKDWTAFLKEMGDIPYQKKRKPNLTEQQCVSYYQILRKELDRVPTGEEWESKYQMNSVSKHFGCWTDFFMKMEGYETMNCPECNKQFNIPKDCKTQFCSTKCRWVFTTGKIPKICERCKKPFRLFWTKRDETYCPSCRRKPKK